MDFTAPVAKTTPVYDGNAGSPVVQRERPIRKLHFLCQFFAGAIERGHSLRNLALLSGVSALLVVGLCSCSMGSRGSLPADIQALPDAVQILLYRPPDVSLGAGEAVVRINGVEVATLSQSDYKIVTQSPGQKEMTVSGGWRSGESVVRFEAKKGQVNRFAIRLRTESESKNTVIGGPTLQIVKEEGTFSFSKL
jgi:hypothetical protein